MLVGRTVLAEAGSTFALALAATTGMAFFLLSIVFLQRTPGVGMDFLLEVFPLFFPLALRLTVPLSALVAVVFTFSRMQQDGELTALAAAGVPLSALARPVLAAAAAVALAAMLLSDVATPFAAARLREAKRDLLHQVQTSFRAGLRDLDFGRGRISFEDFDGRDFTDLCLETGDALWRAERGSIVVTPDEEVVLTLHRARDTKPRKTEAGEAYVSLEDVEVRVPVAELTKGSLRRRPNDQPAWALAYEGARGGRDGRMAMAELAGRSAHAASAFFFALAGIPLGILTARGGRVGAFLLAIAPAMLVTFPLGVGALALAKAGKVPAYPALWAGNAILLVAGLLLLRRVARR